MKQNKDIRITIRLTPEQYKSIRARAETAQMTPSAYIRAAAMRHRIVVVDGLKELTYELQPEPVDYAGSSGPLLRAGSARYDPDAGPRLR